MASLYELAAGYATLLEAYDLAETEEERDEILEILESAEGDLNGKADNFAKVIRMKEEEAKAFKAEADRLNARKSAAENVVKRLKSAMLDSMKMTGKTEIQTSIGKWRVQMNPVSCEVVDIEKVPRQYHIPQEDKIDKKTLLADYKATGELIDGVEFRQEQGIRFR